MSNFIDTTIEIENGSVSDTYKQQNHHHQQQQYHHHHPHCQEQEQQQQQDLEHEREQEQEEEHEQQLLLTLEEEKEEFATALTTLDNNVNITVNVNATSCAIRIKEDGDHEGNGDGVSSNATYCCINDNQQSADGYSDHLLAKNDSIRNAARTIYSHNSSNIETSGMNPPKLNAEMHSISLTATSSGLIHSLKTFSESSVTPASINDIETATNTVITATFSCPSDTTATSCSALPTLSSTPCLKSMFKDHTPRGGRTYAMLIKSGALSASASPRLLRRSPDNIVPLLPRRVSFPKSDNELVTGYLEPANPWGNVCTVKNVTEIADLYTISCHKHNTKPLQQILEHLKAVDLQKQLRQPALTLASIKLSSSDCEALEEIFKRVQYKSIDLSNCDLDETAISALFEMFEYYEATNELNISSNANGMTHRGWVSCNYMIGHSQELQLLNADGNPISKMSAESLGNALSTSNLHTLKLEHCGLRGQPLTMLCFKLRHNRVLKELWLSFNDLDYSDADTIAELLKVNHYLELLDISNNRIQNEGLRLIVIALIMQSKELERRNTFQRSAAIDDDDDAADEADADDDDDDDDGGSISPMESSALSDLTSKEKSDDWDLTCRRLNDQAENSIIEERLKHSSTTDALKKNEKCINSPLVSTLLSTEEVDVEDDSDDTVRSNTVKNSSTPQNGGQSMLDKLLSMNSESSSEDAVSNISTDTLAACCSEDTSLISDEIFDTTTTATTTASITITNTNTNTKTSSKIIDAEELNDITSDEKRANNYANASIDLFITNCKSPLPSTDTPQCDNLNNNVREKDDADSPKSAIFNVTADDETEYLLTSGDLKNTELQHSPSVMDVMDVMDVNKNSKLGEDFDDTHSTDSAFESASEGDISRHLPDEFTRLSTSLETIHLDDVMAKELIVETATIASETNHESLIANKGAPFEKDSSIPLLDVTQEENLSYESLEKTSTSLIASVNDSIDKIPTIVTIDEENLLSNFKTCNIVKENIASHTTSPIAPSPPAGAVICTLRRNESTCAFLTQSSRNCSQSTDSLCSDNSLDGSIGSGDLNFSSSSQVNEKLTKNDTLSRQSKHIDNWPENLNRNPNGLKALFVWNNSLTKDAGQHISTLLAETASLDLLNIGKNCLSNDFLLTIKNSLRKNTTLTTLGLQSAHLSAKGIETLSQILSFGGNNTLQRLDIRGNRIDLESLTSIGEMLKSNTTVTQIDIDKEPKRMCLGSNDDHLDYTRVLENVRTMCSRNEKTQLQMQAEKSVTNVLGKKRSSYYLGSRKISLTCHTRPVFENAKNSTLSSLNSNNNNNNKLDVKRKPGARLRSPVPSPPTISPSSSPNRTSRFQVFRVAEVNSLSLAATKSTTNLDTTKPISSSSVTLSEAIDFQSICCPTSLSTSLPTSCSLPLMSTISSSTQSIKRFSVMPRSRFEVKKVYEDPRVPIANRTMPPIWPSINSTPIQRQVDYKSATASKDNTKISTVDNTENEISPNRIITTTTTEFYTPVITSATSSSTTDTTASKQSTNVSTTVSERNCPLIDQGLLPSHSVLSILSAASPSLSPSSSSSSSSSSTSNLTPSPSESFYSSSSSTSPASQVDSSDTSTAVASIEASCPPNYPVQCPLAVFSDNDITLTKNTISDTLTKAVAATCSTDNHNITVKENDDNGTIAAPTLPQQQQQQQQQRIRKTSWISNPTAVDKLLTLFHNPTNIFQRSSSPEATSFIKPTATTNIMENTIAIRNRSSLSLTSSASSASAASSWTQLVGSEVFGASLATTNELSTTNITTTTTSEQSRSFLDAASRQFRDFSKQVFRQNLSFGNESASAAASITSTTTNNPPLLVSSYSSVGSSSVTSFTTSSTNETVNNTCDAECLPTDVKQEIKENISPEHTINEETLQKLQKLSHTTPMTQDIARDREICEEPIVDNSDSTFTI